MTRWMVAAALVLSMAAGSARAATLDPVLAEYAAWRGGESFIALKSLSETGSFADGGLNGPASLQQNSEGDDRETLRYGQLGTVFNVSGDSGFYTNLAGQRLPFSKIELGFAHSDAALLWPAFLLDRAKLSLRGTQMLGGEPYDVVALSGNDGAEYDYLLARGTGALFGVRTKRDGATETTTYGDWQFVDGVRLPFRIDNEGAAGLGAIEADTTKLTIKSVALNQKLNTDAFAPPPDRMVVSFPPGQSSSGWIPFRLSDHLIFLPISVDGHAVQAILDSGAGLTVLDRNYAATISVHAVGSFTVFGGGGSAGIAYAPGTDVTAGGLHLNGITAGLIDLGLPGTKMSPPLVAILGAETFTQTAVDIDYARRRLRFLKPGHFATPPGGVTLPLGTFEGSFSLPVSMEGRPPIEALLDSGSDGTFAVFPAYWEKRSLLQGRAASTGRGGGVGGLVDYRLASLVSLGLGSIKLPDVPTAFELPGIAANDETGLLGNLGDQILQRFHAIIDFPDNFISLRPNAGLDAGFDRNLVGLETMTDGDKVRIFFVMPGSPAAAARIQAGAQIIKIDGKPAKDIAANDDWQDAGAGKPVTLIFADGTSRTILRKRFF